MNPSTVVTSRPLARVAQAASEAYERPINAPNGLFWPDSSSYLRDYEVLNSDGKSELEIMNNQNDTDYYIKLVDVTTGMTVRHAYIKKHTSFKMADITPGTYYLKYRDLNSGYPSKSQNFEVVEIDNKYSVMNLTLHRVRNGNFKTESISESDFDD